METITPGEMSSIENASESIGVSKLLLMENAGASLSNEIKKRFPNIEGKRILVVIGSGNNGGDGMVCARHLAPESKVAVFLLTDSDSLKSSEASINWRILEKMPTTVKLHQNTSEKFISDLKIAFQESDIIIDGILGTGVRGPLREPIPSIINDINSTHAYKVAIDVPTGLDPETGKVSEPCIKADLTVTFHRAKTGLIGHLIQTGEIVVVPIGIPLEASKD